MNANRKTGPGQAVLALIVLTAALRLALAAAMGLGIDESYMIAAGRTWQWGYFDHPPLAWWLSHGMAQLAGSEAAFVVRLPFIALFAVSTWLMYRLGAALSGARTGAWAALALNLSPVFGITSGGWVLPDGPLDCALLAAAVCLVHALERGLWRWWLAAGAAAGCALSSKYSAALTLAGALVFLVTTPSHRHWLLRPQPYVALLLALALFAPVLLWNAGHGWVSFAFQGGRAGGERFNPAGPLTVLGGEALFVLPWIWLPLMLAWGRALRDGPRHWRGWLLAWLGALPVVLFAVVGLWSRHVLFHWAAPGYLMLFPLLGRALEGWHARWPRLLWRGAAGTAALLVLALGIAASDLRWNWLPLHDPAKDPALQALDWDGLPTALAARGLLDRPGIAIAAAGWQDAGKLGYAMGAARTVLCLSADAREFGVTGNAALADGGAALIVSTKPVTQAGLAAQGFTFMQWDSLPPLAVPLAGGRSLTLQLAEARGLRLMH